MSEENTFTKPRWLRDLVRFLPLKSQFVLSGNIRDLFPTEPSPGIVSAVPMITALSSELHLFGYRHVLIYEPLSGFSSPLSSGTEEKDEELFNQLNITRQGADASVGMEQLGSILERIVNFDGAPLALIVDFASRLMVRQDALSSSEHQLFSRALMLSHKSRARPCGPRRQAIFNAILWLIDKEGDLPDWFLIDNSRIRHIPVPKPDYSTRRTVAQSLLRTLPDGRAASFEDINRSAQVFIDETEGLLLTDLSAIAQLGREEGVHISKLSDAVRRYKVGVTDDPWKKIPHDKIHSAENFIQSRVKGQKHAITHMLDIVKRAVAGVGAGRRGGRPRGVAFLAGPTGVGKTELAKTITSLLFGDESAYIRFDMSEFSVEHSDQRLIGAPPGYVGYDVGGELTNAIREKPFSVVLFDEIEKAHPKILDKFLQILDDGVLTSGRGDRVYFSESLIIFTSNLGIYKLDATGARIPNVTHSDPFDTVNAKVRAEIERHFNSVLNRPEILNRMGENIIIFDFIREEIAETIFDQMVEAILADVARAEIVVTLTRDCRDALRKLCLSDLSNGGRGIRNKVERHLVNPLSRALFDMEAKGGSQYEVVDIVSEGITTVALVKV